MKVARKPGDWDCSCGCMNFASRVQCKQCGAPKITTERTKEVKNEAPTKVHLFRKGDWYCIQCSDHQFASNTTCRKCGASKPVVEEDVSREDSECVVCFANVRNVGFLHGDDVHICCCRECASKLDKCPMCRSPISKTLNVFM